VKSANRTHLIAALVGLLLGSLTVPGPVMGQTVYRAVDEQGNPAFTDRPEEYESAEAIDIQVAGTNRNLIVEQRQAKERKAEDDEVASEIRETHAAEDAAEAQDEQDAVTSNCDNATKRFDKYKNARRLYKEDATGAKVFLSDEATDKARTDAKHSVDEWCDS
jgi:hypothetical protein